MALASAERSIVRLFRNGSAQWHDRLLHVKRLHMLHIGKTGGTALKTALAGARPSGAHLIFHGHNVRLADIPIGEQCFLVVRDPVSRFVSGFYSRQRQGRPRHDYPWNDKEREVFARFATPNELALALSSADDGLRRMADAAMGNIGHVRDHFSRWFRDEAYLRKRRRDVFFVGSQELLENDVAALSALLNVPIELPTDELSAHRNSPDLDRELDEDAIANLRSWYRSDYSFLRLIREWFTHLPDYDAAWSRPMASSCG